MSHIVSLLLLYYNYECDYFSISTALAMTYAGARGQTAREMCRVLRFCPLKFNVHAIFDATVSSLNVANGQYALASANRLFAQKGFTINKKYRKLTTRYYSASMEQLDFDTNPSGAADVINDWVEQQTNNKIKDLLSAEAVEDAVLVLVNAIYFKAMWHNKFDPKLTRSGTFQVSTSQTVPVKMMSNRGEFRYCENQQLQCKILELPYTGKRLAMYVLLPNEIDGLASLESKVTYTSVISALAMLRSQTVAISFPRFEMTLEMSLSKVLKAMGMTQAFKDNADFSGISSYPLSVSDVIHKAFVKVGETGTEAAAATAVIIGVTGIFNQKYFYADHPFLLLIRDNYTGSILFLGRLMKP